MKLKISKAIFFIGLLCMVSCASYKNVPYFTDIKQNDEVEKITNYEPFKLEKGDIISIHISSLNPQADAVFNSNTEYKLDKTSNSFAEADNSGNNTAFGYLVDSEGAINLPYIGQMKVLGMTTRELATQIQTKLGEYFTKPIINIRIQNFNVTVLGDVKNPGVFRIQNERVSLTEALSLAGDLNITGIRTNVLLIRENNGVRKYYHIDLTSKALFNSPYYYLKNNDQIYVQPNRSKVTNSDNSTFQKASLSIAVLSLIAYLIRYH